MKKFEIKAIIKTAALYNLAGMYNIDNEFDDNTNLLILSTADEFSFVGTSKAQYETALDQYDYLSHVLKSRVKEIETLILKNIKPHEMNAKELNYLVNNFLNNQVAA